MRWLVACACAAALWAGCDSGSGGPPGADLGALCDDSAACDDGVFCNGVERCAPADVDADAFGCAPGPLPCLAGQSCNEGARVCATSCAVSADADGDGYAAERCGGDDCDDSDADRFPGNPEVCDDFDHDEDCDPLTVGELDEDEDGVVSAECCNVPSGAAPICGEDCDDAMPGVHPTAPEVCNGVDDDCSGHVDDGPAFLCALGSVEPCFPANAPAGLTTCNATCGGYGACLAPSEGPSVRLSCNGLDDDGDGDADDGFACVQHETRACSTACGTSGVETCAGDCSGFGACVVSGETCNYCDDDGDGTWADDAAETTPTQGVSLYPCGGLLLRQGFACVSQYSVQSPATGTTVSALEYPDPIRVGFGPVTFTVEALVFVGVDPPQGGWAIWLYRDGVGSATVGSAANLGRPTERDGFAAQWHFNGSSADYGWLYATRAGAADDTLDSRAGVASDGIPDPGTGTSTRVVFQLRLVPDDPFTTSVDELRVDVGFGTSILDLQYLMGCQGAFECELVFQPGESVRFGVSAADPDTSANGSQFIGLDTDASTFFVEDACSPL